MNTINLKMQNGIYKQFKIVDAFLIKENNLTVVLLYNDEVENNLLKIYIAKYEDNALTTIIDSDWEKIKVAMSNIISNKNDYELVKLPDVLNQNGFFKPCLIQTIKHFQDHYKEVTDGVKNLLEENKFRFTSGVREWEKEETEEKSIEELASKAKEELEKEKNNSSNMIEGNDYKEQKQELIRIISKSVDDILEIKNKEIVKLNDVIDSLESELRKTELEKIQALNVIELYHEKIKKLNEAFKGKREE